MKIKKITPRNSTVLSQVALGIGDIDSNPDLKDMILYA
jgi:hypothetical protein